MAQLVDCEDVDADHGNGPNRSRCVTSSGFCQVNGVLLSLTLWMLRAVSESARIHTPPRPRLEAVHFDMEQYAYKDLTLYPEAVVDGR